MKKIILFLVSVLCIAACVVFVPYRFNLKFNIESTSNFEKGGASVKNFLASFDLYIRFECNTSDTDVSQNPTACYGIYEAPNLYARVNFEQKGLSFCQHQIDKCTFSLFQN